MKMEVNHFLTLNKILFLDFEIYPFVVPGFIFDDLILSQNQVNLYSLSDENDQNYHYAGSTDTDLRWKNNVIPFALSLRFNSSRKSEIRNIAQYLNNILGGCLHFREKMDSDQDYVWFTQPTKYKSLCRSKLGRQGGRQDISIGSFCQRHDIIHEILHCVGLLHEHSRPDRDNYVEILIDNVREDRKGNFEIFKNQWSYGEPYDHKVSHKFGNFQ